MIRTLLILAAGIGVGMAAMAATQHDEKEVAKSIAAQDIFEKLDGKEAKVTFVEVTYEPNQAGKPHRHPGPVFGYVLEGEYEWAIDGQPSKVLKAGETFYEPSRCLHRVTKNPSAKSKTRLLAVVLHARDAQEITIPEPKK
jgi:quercetin dioxygenase-like cupin family protein